MPQDREAEKLEYQLGREIQYAHYSKAITAVLLGTGDLRLAALLAIARELRYLSEHIGEVRSGVYRIEGD